MKTVPADPAHPNYRRYEFLNSDGTISGEVADNNSRSVARICAMFARKIGQWSGQWSGQMHNRKTGRVYDVAIAPGELPVCTPVLVVNDRPPAKPINRKKARAIALPTVFDKVRGALPIAGQIFYPQTLAQRLKLTVNDVVPELVSMADYEIVRPVVPKMRHGQRPPVLADLPWRVVPRVAAEVAA